MRVDRPGVVYLKPGEVIPIFCPCGNVYQPEYDPKKNSSYCSKCKNRNRHPRVQTYQPIRPRKLAYSDVYNRNLKLNRNSK